MAKDKQLRPIEVSKEIRYTADSDIYIVQMKRPRRFPWWIILLLLPLLLLIRCNKDIEVLCCEAETNLPVGRQDVNMTYQAHYLWDNGRLFATDTISITQTTDSIGVATFRNLPCSVYSYIFYCLSKVTFRSACDCYEDINEPYNFHLSRHVELLMQPRREDLHVKLVDLETGDPLPGAILRYKYTEAGQERIDSVQADAAGIATMPMVRLCSVVDLLHGQCYGYADTTRADVPCRFLVTPSDSMALRLRPLKERFTFFVKNVETKQPIPAAECAVSLTHPISKKVDGPHIVMTSIDGKGIVVYDETFVLSTIHIKAHKEHYRDSILTGGPWTVEKFIKQDDDTRTIWLKPLPYTSEFINLDSITGKPIAGVRNIIKVTDPDGTEHTSEEISNRNGVFPVEAKEDSKIEIISIDDPGYKKKHTEIPRFRDRQEREIRMSPNMVSLVFRTVNASKPNELLPNCNLRVYGSISGDLPPAASGTGAFEVSFRKNENLTIRATRTNWVPTTDKVNAKNFDYLSFDQERRDIPLKQNLPPCSAGKHTPKASNEMHHERTYGMGQEEGTASIWVDFYDEPDRLRLIDGEGNVILDRMVRNKNQGGMNPIPFRFKGGSVTVIIETSMMNGSSWEYILNCPN